jgi:hypothetical protein
MFRNRVIVVHRFDPSRWNLERLAAMSVDEDFALASAEIDDWAQRLDEEDRATDEAPRRNEPDV